MRRVEKILNRKINIQCSQKHKMYTNILRKLYWVLHLVGCPNEKLTAEYKVRYCRCCGRLRFKSREEKKRFKNLGQFKELGR